jgi:hypothetical protein
VVGVVVEGWASGSPWGEKLAENEVRMSDWGESCERRMGCRSLNSGKDVEIGPSEV